jgi:hypothetical protein
VRDFIAIHTLENQKFDRCSLLAAFHILNSCLFYNSLNNENCLTSFQDE